MTHLYEISNEYQRLLDKQEYSDEDLEMLNCLDSDIKAKAITIASHIKNLEAEEMAVQNAIEDMITRRKRLRGKIDRLENYLIYNMEKCHLETITDSPLFVIKVSHNPPSVEIVDELSIPAKYLRMHVKETHSWDKTEIKKDYANGIQIPGVQVTIKKRIEIK